ncbi:E3 ubiquitin-protein ligase UHRF1-like [Tribolium madens]|uniref:E3 ubiquitin-protein ligase UHRF1-like n=1 Tax=Tribolium madens TaxID=41895 RepID=UPI001CF74EDD|nr:E3 ubiquitin-protein ligase UHRF1-like [Tribolium madens]
MHVRIRKLTSTSKDNDLILVVSKTASIKELQAMIKTKLNVEIDHQKLYYRGKQLIEDHTIADYDIKLNDVIQLLIKLDSVEQKTGKENKSPNTREIKTESQIEAKSRYYENGDKIDVIDSDHGAWFEAKILNIFGPKGKQSTDESDLVFRIKMDRNGNTAAFDVTFSDIRPRAYYTYKESEIKPGLTVLANYNIENPTTRGYWYDFEIKAMTKKGIKGTLLVGTDHARLENCTIKFIDELLRIENPTLLNERLEKQSKEIPLRKLPLYCTKCKDNSAKNCKDCGCQICSKKENAGILILCDECDDAFHLSCLIPPLSAVPTEEWYCPDCKIDDSEIVKAGEKLKTSKKKMKMPSYKGANRDWGKGMACVGRTSECTIVPKDHYGPVPGVEVGTCWKFRVQVSEAGIHRPHVAGIHGRENDGAYSLVLSGGYEDDIDNGEEFYYTGSGGRDLSGNKRVNGQSCDQKLTRMNKALALNCNVKFNDKTGGEAIDWRKGKPVRVVRNYKLRKHSKYAPLDGNRYDGIYKVVKYYPQKGKSGFIVWRYLLRRDDPVPAPWVQGGREFEMIYPPGYQEAEALKQDQDNKKKRKHQESSNNLKEKKTKIEPYKLTPEIEQMIKDDHENKKLWVECKEVLREGKLKFLNKVEELFICVCCQEIVFEPITMSCKHNVCKRCLKRSFTAQIYVCPCCRFELGDKYVLNINENLGNILKTLFPGYDSGR